MRKQPLGGDAFVDHIGGHGRLHELFTTTAHPLATNVALHREGARRVIEPLRDVLAHALQRCATARARALGGGRLVVKLAPWQIGGQRHATGLSWRGCFTLDAVLAQGLEL